MTAVIRMVAVMGTAVTMLAAATGVAAADFTGYTYSQASAQITKDGSKAIIASVVGDQLPMGDCIVTSSSVASNLDSSGRSRGYAVNLHLNCNASVASAGVPGNSAASPAGRTAKANIATAEWCAQPAQQGNSSCAIWCPQHTELCDKAAAAAEEAAKENAVKEEKTAEWCALPAQAGNSNCAIFCEARAELCQSATAKVVEAAREQKPEG